MDENVYRVGLTQQKMQYMEFLCAGSQALDSLAAALGDLQSCFAPPLGCCESRDRLGPGLFDFRCTARTSKLTALPTHFLGLKVCLTWIQVLALPLTSCENMGDSLSLCLIFLMCK